jgi:hypothetical protein
MCGSAPMTYASSHDAAAASGMMRRHVRHLDLVVIPWHSASPHTKHVGPCARAASPSAHASVGLPLTALQSEQREDLHDEGAGLSVATGRRTATAPLPARALAPAMGRGGDVNGAPPPAGTHTRT